MKILTPGVFLKHCFSDLRNDRPNRKEMASVFVNYPRTCGQGPKINPWSFNGWNFEGTM